MTIAREKFDPIQTLDFVVQMFQMKAQMHGVNVSYSLVPYLPIIDSELQTGLTLFNQLSKTIEKEKGNLPKYLIGDNRRLKQVLINLIKNALKFTKRGEVKVNISFRPREQLLVVHVKDTGAGIAAEDFPKLFTRFGKLQRTAEMNNEGIGLGLTIVKKIVELNEG